MEDRRWLKAVDIDNHETNWKRNEHQEGEQTVVGSWRAERHPYLKQHSLDNRGGQMQYWWPAVVICKAAVGTEVFSIITTKYPGGVLVRLGAYKNVYTAREDLERGNRSATKWERFFGKKVL